SRPVSSCWRRTPGSHCRASKLGSVSDSGMPGMNVWRAGSWSDSCTCMQPVFVPRSDAFFSLCLISRPCPHTCIILRGDWFLGSPLPLVLLLFLHASQFSSSSAMCVCVYVCVCVCLCFLITIAMITHTHPHAYRPSYLCLPPLLPRPPAR